MDEKYKKYCEIRDSKGLSDAEVARRAGVPKSTFSDWKMGRSTPKFVKLDKIANALDVSVDVFGAKKVDLVIPERLLKEIKHYSNIQSGIDDETASLEERLIEIFYECDKEDREHLIQYAEFLLQRNGRD